MAKLKWETDEALHSYCDTISWIKEHISPFMLQVTWICSRNRWIYLWQKAFTHFSLISDMLSSHALSIRFEIPKVTGVQSSEPGRDNSALHFSEWLLRFHTVHYVVNLGWDIKTRISAYINKNNEDNIFFIIAGFYPGIFDVICSMYSSITKVTAFQCYQKYIVFKIFCDPSEEKILIFYSFKLLQDHT